jgi:hypothetical protein
MRTVTLVVALAAVCAASPALSQALILSVQDQPTAAQPQTPPPASAPAPAAVPSQTKKPEASQVQTQGETQAKRQDREPPQPPSRYRFFRVDNGFLRLDHNSGQVSYCTSQTAGWSCAAVMENSAALERQIAQLRDEIAAMKKEVPALRDEVAALKKEVAALREPPPSRPPAPILPPAATPPPAAAPPNASPENNGGIALPSQQDIARARAYIAETWHRLVDMITQLQKDMMGKRDNGGANGVSRT